MLEIMSKKLFGEKYEKIFKSVMACIILYAGLRNLNYNITVAHSVLMFINLTFSASVMIQFLDSKDNAGYLKGYFAMPFKRKSFISSYAVSMGIYVMTKTMIIYAFIMAFARVNVLEILLIIAEYIFICLGSMAVFAYFSERKYISLLIAIIGIVLCFLLPSKPISAVVYLSSAFLLLIILFNTDPYKFMANRSETAHKIKNNRSTHFLVTKYIMRYIISNRSYLISPVITVAFICFLVINMKNMGFNDGILIGLALISMNTPLGIVVSSNRGLHSKLNSMPSKLKNFFIPYACVLFVYYIIASSVLITVLSFFGIVLSMKIIAVSILFSLQSAAATAFMEDKSHITNWKVETDLWHNPRKYIVPIVLTLEAGLIAL